MKKELENLKTILFGGAILGEYLADVSVAIEKLEDKIDELENRMDCARKCAEEISKAISPYRNAVDTGIQFVMKVQHYDTIHNCSDDVRISLNLDDDTPIVDNWYSLFAPPPKKEVFITFHSSWGELDCDRDGNVLEVRGEEEEINGERNYLFDIVKVDLREYGKFCESLNITMGECADILSVGFWDKNTNYSTADKKWRKQMFGKEEEEIPTMLCQDKDKHEVVKDVVAKLKDIDVDGETLQYIIEQLGMNDQMLRQLVLTNPYTDTADLLKEKEENKFH